jgi:hypothetical protein
MCFNYFRSWESGKVAGMWQPLMHCTFLAGVISVSKLYLMWHSLILNSLLSAYWKIPTLFLTREEWTMEAYLKLCLLNISESLGINVFKYHSHGNIEFVWTSLPIDKQFPLLLPFPELVIFHQNTSALRIRRLHGKADILFPYAQPSSQSFESIGIRNDTTKQSDSIHYIYHSQIQVAQRFYICYEFSITSTSEGPFANLQNLS